MRWNIDKIEHLKTCVCGLRNGVIRQNKLSAELGEIDCCCPAWGKKNATLNREVMGNEKLAIKISKLVHEIGINDIDPDRTWHDGWSERK
jgi:hypothetical protein